MRSALLVIGLLCVTPAFADRLLFTPVGGKLRSDQIRSEVFFEGYQGARLLYVGAGIGDSFDFEVNERWSRGQSRQATLDFSYNYVNPFPDYAPGISFGVLDLADQTREGLSLFAVITWRYNQLDPWNDETPLEFSIGTGTGRFTGVFVSARLPFSNQLRFLIEHDSQEVAAGFEIVPIKNARVLWTVRGDQPSLGFGYSVKF